MMSRKKLKPILDEIHRLKRKEVVEPLSAAESSHLVELLLKARESYHRTSLDDPQYVAFLKKVAEMRKAGRIGGDCSNITEEDMEAAILDLFGENP